MKSILKVIAISIALGASFQTVVRATDSGGQYLEASMTEDEVILIDLLSQRLQSRQSNGAILFTDEDESQLAQTLTKYIRQTREQMRFSNELLRGKEVMGVKESAEPGI
ncbi:MAG: hypothetical protein SGJ18_00845 [Pseudomonadota bacterium]|nr:hypothetical protein [Pseudomonadota bacterium]